MRNESQYLPSGSAGPAALWRAWRARRAHERERIRTIRILSDLPRDLRADIGWPARYYSECESE